MLIFSEIRDLLFSVYWWFVYINDSIRIIICIFYLIIIVIFDGFLIIIPISLCCFRFSFC